MIGGSPSDLLIACKADGNFGNVSAGVLFSKVAYQQKWSGKISYKIFHNCFRVINGIEYRYTCMIAFSVQAVCGIAYKSLLLGCEDWL